MRLIEFIITSSVLTLMPGPDILFVATQSIVQGKRAGISVALGLASGLFVHTAAAAFGLSLLIASSPNALTVIKYLGIAYLIYMGISSLRGMNKQSSGSDEEGVPQASSGWKLYRTGITMNLLNPKVIIFFLALFPQFIGKESGSATTDVLILGAVFAVVAVTIFTVVALLSDFLSSKFSVRSASPRILSWVKAAVYWLIAVMFFFY